MLSWPRVESLKTKLRVDTLGYKFSSELELRLVTILATSLAEVKLMIKLRICAYPHRACGQLMTNLRVNAVGIDAILASML